MDDHTEHPTYEEAATAGAPSDTPISAEEASAAVHASYAHPERVGGYEIVDVLGEGGFGLVYLAEQRDKVARRVALKVIKPGMDSKSVLTRFSAERQTLALMNHPGLAKVFDAGMTEDGRPYFVMELVHGEAINRFCDKKKLTIEDRLELFMQVCDAIQHAHMKGVIHRDLKPGNILVETPEGGPRVRVIDFGVAKALHTKPGEVLATEAGQVIGTPEFMSPEQARGSDAIDTRSDVYALGVVLYELLTGRLPFDSREMRETGPLGMIRFIEEVEPPKPSVTVTGKRKKASAESEIRELGEVNWKAAAEKRGLDEKKLHDRLKGDLDWIVMKCLAKDQERRYESPSALARDIKNYLDDRPVSAGPPSLRYQAGKFLKRNRVGVSAALLVLLALVLGFGTAVVGFVRASNEADRARLAEAEAERRADELAKTVEFQAATFSEVDIEQLGRFVGDRILSRLATDLQRSGVSAAESTEQLQPIKEALQLINLTDLGRDVINEGVFRRAVESLSTAFSDEPLVEASLRHTLAETCRELGLIDLALENVGRALDLRRGYAGDEARSTLDSRDLRAMVLVSQSRTDEARAIIEETLEAREKLFGPDDPDTLESVDNLALLRFTAGDRTEALELFRRAAEGRERAIGPAHPKTLESLGNTATLLRLEERYDESAEVYRRAIARARERHGDKHEITLGLQGNFGRLLREQGKNDEALELYTSTYEGFADLRGEEHSQTLARLSSLAALQTRLGQNDAAIESFRRILTIRREMLPPGHDDRLLAARRLAFAYERGDQRDEALLVLDEALDEASARSTEGVVSILELNRAEFLVDAGRYQQAEAAFTRAMRFEHSDAAELRIVQGFATLYSAWHQADPTAGHDAKAREWRAKLPRDD